MNKDLTVHPSSDMQNIAVSTSDPAQVPHMQATLLAWCREKLARTKVETQELEESIRIAVENGFRRTAFENALHRSAKLEQYYEKIIQAMEAGYCIFPTTDVEVFAVRTARKKPSRDQRDANSWDRDPAARGVAPGILPAGAGRNVDDEPVVFQSWRWKTVTKPDKTTEEVHQKYFYSQKLNDEIALPLVIAKPEVLEATGRAMAIKIFDEIGILPVQQDTDPVIVGRIIHPVNKKRVSFLVSWFVDSRDL